MNKDLLDFCQRRQSGAIHTFVGLRLNWVCGGNE